MNLYEQGQAAGRIVYGLRREGDLRPSDEDARGWAWEACDHYGSLKSRPNISDWVEGFWVGYWETDSPVFNNHRPSFREDIFSYELQGPE